MAEQNPKLYTPPKPAVLGSQPAPQPVDPNDPRYTKPISQDPQHPEWPTGDPRHQDPHFDPNAPVDQNQPRHNQNLPPNPNVPHNQGDTRPYDPNMPYDHKHPRYNQPAGQIDPRYNPNVLTGQIDPRTNQPRPTDKNQDTTELQRLQSHLTDHTMRMTPEQRRDAEARVGVLKQKIAAVYK